eukprot:UN27824
MIFSEQKCCPKDINKYITLGSLKDPGAKRMDELLHYFDALGQESANDDDALKHRKFLAEIIARLLERKHAYPPETKESRAERRRRCADNLTRKSLKDHVGTLRRDLKNLGEEEQVLKEDYENLLEFYQEKLDFAEEVTDSRVCVIFCSCLQS